MGGFVERNYPAVPMKRPTLELFERQKRLARYRAKDRCRGQRPYVIGPNRYVFPGEVIRAPAKIDITRGSGIEVFKFLRAAARRVLEFKQPVVLDFRGTESMYPAGMILIFAEVDRLVSSAGFPKPVTIRDPRVRVAREVLKQIEIHQITGDVCNTVPERQDVVFWKAAKGNTQSGTALSMLPVIADRVNMTHTRRLEVSGFWGGVTEAVGNSIEHAYKFPRADGFHGLESTKWWMFTQLRDGIFTMAVCDLGCGYRATIDGTLPENFRAAVAAKLGWANRDSSAIQTAMEYGRSGTKKTERGKGSRDAMSVLQRHRSGSLMILSNTGWVRYSYANGKPRPMENGDLGINIGATILFWRLPLTEETA